MRTVDRPLAPADGAAAGRWPGGGTLQRRGLRGAALSLAAAALAWTGPAGRDAAPGAMDERFTGPAQPAASPIRSSVRASAVARPEEPAAAAATADHAFDRWVATRSALRGSALDGGWGLDAQGRLQPSSALRRRFDHLLQLMGQAPMERITDLLARQAQADLQADDAAGVLRVWHAYLGLLADPGRASLQAGETPAAALAERRLLRRQWLGIAWAEAFYAEEEAALALHLAGGPPPSAPPALIDRAALPPEALQRLAEEEARQARWQQMLADTRDEVQRLRAAPELSAPLLAAALDRLVNERFATGSDRLRARALLGLPPG